jgi:hypothetical protein
MVGRRSQGGGTRLGRMVEEVEATGQFEQEFARKDLQEEIRQSSDRLISQLLAVPEGHPLSDRGYRELFMELYAQAAEHVVPQDYPEELRHAIETLQTGLIRFFPSVSKQEIPVEQKLARIASIYNFLNLVLEEPSTPAHAVDRQVDCEPELLIDRHWRGFIPQAVNALLAIITLRRVAQSEGG